MTEFGGQDSLVNRLARPVGDADEVSDLPETVQIISEVAMAGAVCVLFPWPCPAKTMTRWVNIKNLELVEVAEVLPRPLPTSGLAVFSFGDFLCLQNIFAEDAFLLLRNEAVQALADVLLTEVERARLLPDLERAQFSLACFNHVNPAGGSAAVESMRGTLERWVASAELTAGGDSSVG